MVGAGENAVTDRESDWATKNAPEVAAELPNGNHRVRYREHLPTEIGDALTIDDAPWVRGREGAALRTTPDRAAVLHAAQSQAETQIGKNPPFLGA
jgi:hypothetical protein